jgi:hypothetical protein
MDRRGVVMRQELVFGGGCEMRSTLDVARVELSMPVSVSVIWASRCLRERNLTRPTTN